MKRREFIALLGGAAVVARPGARTAAKRAGPGIDSELFGNDAYAGPPTSRQGLAEASFRKLAVVEVQNLCLQVIQISALWLHRGFRRCPREAHLAPELRP